MFISCGAPQPHIGRSQQLALHKKTNQGRSGHMQLYVLPTRVSFPFKGSIRGHSTRKDKLGPWWLLWSSFDLFKSLLSKAFYFSKMHVLYSFSVVKSGEIIRHNYSLHLLCGRSHFKPAAQQILYPPHLLLCKHMPLKKDSNSITTLKQQWGSKAPWPRLTQPECIAIFIPRAERIEGTQNYFCD